jgi:ABC-type phosphate transport system substrate-binding protein
MRKSVLFFVLAGFLSTLLQGTLSPSYASDQAADDVVIIGNSKLAIDSLSPDDLKDIFQRKKTLWEDGQKISFAILDGGKTHQRFVRQYLQKTPAQYHRYWKKLVFSGRGVPPMSFRTEKSLMAHVALTAGAIGYVSGDTKLSNVKRLKIVDEGAAVSGAPPDGKSSSTVEKKPPPPTSKAVADKPEQTLFNRLFN